MHLASSELLTTIVKADRSCGTICATFTILYQIICFEFFIVCCYEGQLRCVTYLYLRLVFPYKLRYSVGFGLVEMVISTNPKPTIYPRTRLRPRTILPNSRLAKGRPTRLDRTPAGAGTTTNPIIILNRKKKKMYMSISSCFVVVAHTDIYCCFRICLIYDLNVWVT